MEGVKNLRHKGVSAISIEELADKLNEFGESEGIQVTHTQTHISDGKFYAMVFYKELGLTTRDLHELGKPKKEIKSVDEEEEHSILNEDKIPTGNLGMGGATETKPEKKTNGGSTIGCLWTRKKTLTGNLNGETITVDHDTFKGMPETTSRSGKVMKIGELEDVKVKIMPNSFKTENKHPDYVIYPRGE